MNKTLKTYMKNVIIIGGGPSGLSAAIYAARSGLEPLVLAGSPPGGQLILTSEVENYPGFEAVLGAELIQKMRQHALKFNVDFIDENVIKVDFSGKYKMVATKGDEYQSKAVIIATGAKALWLNLPSETRLRGKGVSACATCDGFFFREKIVAVVGGGDTAMEEASTLTKFAKKVYLIHRRDSFRASKIMQDRVLNNPKIEIVYNTSVEEVMGENKVEGLKLKIMDGKSLVMDKHKEIYHLGSSINNLKCDGLFVAIGHKPDTDLFKDKVEMDKKGYIITTQRYTYDNFQFQISNDKSILNSKFQTLNFPSMTSIPGVFAAGDCVDYQYRQAATAVGMGVASALDVEKWLEENIE